MNSAHLANTDSRVALADAREQYVRSNPKSLAQYEIACEVFPGGNTRTVLFYPPFPLTMNRGEGAYLWDVDDHHYTDFLGEFTAGLYGHSHPVIRAAINRAMDNGISFGAHNSLEAKLASVVCDRFPSIESVRFTNSGTEANLMAISAACAITQRKGVMVFYGSYHGGVFFFAGGGSPINAPFSFIVAPYNDLENTVRLIEEHARDLAAIILEPMMGVAGCLPADGAFLQAVRNASAKHGIILIFDEVMTSRLSAGGLQKTYGIDPDMTTLGKYVGGGMSFGAFGGRSEIMKRFDPRRTDAFPHAGTFNNNVLTMSAGYAGLSQIYTPEIADAHNAKGDKLRERLNAVAQRKEVKMQFTGIGSMLAVHMQRGPIRTPKDLAGGNDDLRDLFFFDLLAHGIWIARRGMMTISLPVSETDYDALVNAVDEFTDRRRSLLI